MKTGKVRLVTVAFGVIIAGASLVRMTMIPEQKPGVSGLGKVLKNSAPHTQVPNFSAIKNAQTKKTAFFDFLKPMVKHQNAIIEGERTFLIGVKSQIEQHTALTDADEFRLQHIAEKYQYASKRINTNTLTKLLTRVDTIPEQMVLIQAANETGWGSSRFAREGFNFFGQWCFRKGCGLVPRSRSHGLYHEVATFKSVDDSVAAYMRNLNSNAAYSLFRSIRADMRAKNEVPTAQKLVYGLVNYSERQEAYIDDLLRMLRQNQPYLADNK